MELLNIIEKIIGHIAWPLAAILIASFFKDEGSDFIGRIKNAKYKGVELNLGEEIAAVKKEAEDAAITVLYPQTRFPEERVRNIEQNPEWAFIQSWQDIESVLTRLYAKTSGSSGKRPPINGVIHYLESNSVIESDFADLIIKINSVRSRIVHVSASEITRGEALEWLGIFKSVKDRLAQKL